MIKAIATDLDGTLFYPKRRIRLISTANRQFIRNAISNGKDVILVTGRNYNVASKVEERIGVKKSISIIGCNGAFITHNDEVIRESCIDNEKAINLYNELNKDENIHMWMIMTSRKKMLIDPSKFNIFEKGLGILILLSQGAYFESSTFGQKKMLRILQDSETKVYKLMPWFGFANNPKERAKKACENWTQKYGEDFQFCWADDCVEIMAKGTNKAEALQFLTEKIGVQKDQVAVVGDSGNDISLFKSFENSFVMSHAPDSVKKEAKIIIDSVSDLEKYI